MARPRLLRAAAGLALLAALASACATSSSTPTSTAANASTIPELSPDQKVSIVFESYNLANVGTWKPVIEGLLRDFQAAHPNITVKGQPPQNLAGSANSGDYVTSIKNQVLAGSPPDVAQITFNALRFAAGSLGAQPLDTLVGREAVQANFGGEHPFAPKARTLGDVDGKTYAVPYVFSTPVLWLNKTLFTQAGLDPAKPPKTWAEVKTAALAIKAKTGKDGVLIDCLTKVGDWCFQSLVRSAGGRVISTDGTKLSFADPPGVEAVSMAADLVHSGVMPNLDQKQQVKAFSSGQAGMLLESSSLQGMFMAGAKANNWQLDATQEPSFGSKPVIPTNSGAALAIFSKDPAKQRAAWELIKFLTGDHAYTEISSKIGYLPLRTGLIDDPKSLQAWAKANPLIKPNLDQLARIEPWESFPGDNYLQISDTMMTAVESAVFTGKDPASTLAAAQKQATSFLPRK
ncbi:carbohydrate ABC transporter substrate-binding protein, CUT1 family [Frankia casuarinae]|uniref:Carbohydrate ABC transporter substrate-binding protein, CUT1 family n=2 Tax=Frankia casuarinae (strain DSM 45818 / CECT 9043 / HFP020203 / CcI3) TaxID=106370 RepID=Q2J950_FRACC|nr:MULTISPECIES: ABC transporter substrate-binding protein [Frankia]ABD12192.1 carbohydrate ABC transporter substrate-binding protein, CUT1 family [Frankia casuarinae]ETA02490.1 carbohydrate ABC transporter substrate-binding protein, CUT1 family [Frankia sp. CcI6]EYT92118.1 carbohydrate ABC transporter substrate-binding protein, CUT1 family [Frankia casuarinae]KDA43149.1 carbohydrate ABC transporter substrate-binding protein, CUT1 family [Frankia sp. BMG5.23]KEZ36037.1 carbohydrate ABC transpo